MELELSPAQLALIAALVPILAQLIKFVAGLADLPNPSRGFITGLAFVLSIILAAVWVGVELPAGSDPMEVAGAIVAQAAAILGLATLAYNIILKRLFEYFGFEYKG